MSGFDNGTLQQGVFAQTKLSGAVLVGNGPPAPGVGAVGDMYRDQQTSFLYQRRADNKTDPWGNYLYAVPAPYAATLRWFSTTRPSDKIGSDGDYCLLWGAYPNYGIYPSILGPKAAGAWPANPVDVAVAPNPIYSAENSHAV